VQHCWPPKEWEQVNTAEQVVVVVLSCRQNIDPGTLYIPPWGTKPSLEAWALAYTAATQIILPQHCFWHRCITHFKLSVSILGITWFIGLRGYVLSSFSLRGCVGISASGQKLMETEQILVIRAGTLYSYYAMSCISLCVYRAQQMWTNYHHISKSLRETPTIPCLNMTEWWCIAEKSSVPQGMIVCFNKEVGWCVGIAVILRSVRSVASYWFGTSFSCFHSQLATV
jgi:hypothetical protein